jgi:ABC-2 type transport system permease protein
MEHAAAPAGWWAACRAVAGREAAFLWRSPWDLAMLSWLPLGVCALVAWIFAAGIARDLPIVLVDADHSALSRSLGRMLDASPGLAVAAQTDRWDEAVVLLRERQAYGVVWIPAHLQRDLLGGRAATVQWFVNGQFQAHAGGMTRDVRTVVATMSAGIELAAREKRGAAPVQARVQFEPIRLKLSTLFNENANYESFLTLALLPSILQIFIALAAVTAVGRELKAGSVPAWLGAAGGRWGAALAGKLLWPALAFGVQAALFVAVFAGWRGWAVQGSGLAIALGLAGLIGAYLALGLLLIALTLTLRNAISFAAFLTAPAFAFCGQGFPLLAMPPLARAWAQALPLTHYLQIQSRHWTAGAPAFYSTTELLILCGFTLGAGGLALLLLRRRAAQPSAWGRS